MYNIAIFCGGKSLESDISVVSALSLAKVLKLNRRDFILFMEIRMDHFINMMVNVT